MENDLLTKTQLDILLDLNSVFKTYKNYLDFLKLDESTKRNYESVWVHFISQVFHDLIDLKNVSIS